MKCIVLCLLQGEYEALAKKLSEYVVKLLDHVRGNDELDVILNEEVDGYGPDCHGKLARLKLAIKFNEKRVCIVVLNFLVASYTLYACNSESQYICLC